MLRNYAIGFLLATTSIAVAADPVPSPPSPKRPVKISESHRSARPNTKERHRRLSPV